MGKKIAAIKEKENRKEQSVLQFMATAKNRERQKDRLFKDSVFNLNTYLSITQKNILQSFFIRPIEQFKFKTKSKDEVRLNKEMSSYLFEKFQVPSFLRPVMWKNVDVSTLSGSSIRKCTWGDELEWYLCVAQGGSLYKKHLKSLFTKKEVHIFLNQKVANSIGDAFVFAVAMSETENYSLATTLSRTKMGSRLEKVLLMKNLLNHQTAKEFQEKKVSEALSIIRLFARLMENHSVSEIDDIFDYVSHRTDNEQNFTVVGKGYTFEILSKATHNWHHELRRNKLSREFIGKKWAGFGLGEQEITMTVQNDEKITLFFSEILDGATLDREGKVQRHCVYSYLQRCMTGSCSIVRLHNGGYKSLVTLEIKKGMFDSFSIVQARRFANQKPKDQERRFILHWAKKNNLNIGEYVF